MDDVVAAAVAQQVHEHAQPEHERRQDAPARRSSVYSAMRGPARHDPHAPVDLGVLAALPLAQRQVGDLVTLGCQALGEVAIPALGAPDRVGVEAVVDEADAHPASISSRQRTDCATFAATRYNAAARLEAHDFSR